MLWLYLALLAYLINAVAFIIDKHLLAAPIPKYHAYAFGVSVLSFSSIVLLPFGVSWYGLSYLLIAVACGAAFFLGLICLYKSIKESDVSIAATQVGTFSAIFTYAFSFVILRDVLAPAGLIALVLLTGGIFFLGKVQRHVVVSAIIAGIFFGLSYVLLKLAFNNSNFVNGLFWTRMGFVATAFLSLAWPIVREELKFSYKNAPSQAKLLFISNKVLGGIGFTLLYFAIRLGDVSLVNALLGFQFLFVFLLVLIFKNTIPGINEGVDKPTLAKKIIGLTSVLIGFLLLIFK